MRRRQPKSLVQFFRQSPLLGLDLDLERDKDTGARWSYERRGFNYESWLELELPVRFRGRILAVDEGVADRWGWLAAHSRRQGKPIPIIDGLLAATALHHNLTVGSRNAADFAAARVPVLNPWYALLFN
ncbi:MAG TPA: PIN domain-containing protein [Bryobacteraceae bacterium]|nr:PIN domain-containing protein [Bryobacteraceae bacterium]